MSGLKGGNDLPDRPLAVNHFPDRGTECIELQFSVNNVTVTIGHLFENTLKPGFDLDGIGEAQFAALILPLCTVGIFDRYTV